MGTLTASRTTRYGHDLRGEVIGEDGAVQIGASRKTPMRLLDRGGVHHDMVRTTPERMGEAFVTQLQAFVDCLPEIKPALTIGTCLAEDTSELSPDRFHKVKVLLLDLDSGQHNQQRLEPIRNQLAKWDRVFHFILIEIGNK